MKALLIILIIFTILLLLPVGVDGGYSKNRLALFLKIGPFNIRAFPGKLFNDLTKSGGKKNKKTEKIQKKYRKEKPKKEKPDLSLAEITGIIKIGFKSLGKLKRHISIDYLRIHYTHASDNPFDTAKGYGYANAILGTITPLADTAFNIKEKDFGLDFDFFEEKPAIDVWITATIQIWELFYIAFALGIDFWRMKIKQKRNKPTQERTDTNGKTSDR